jgi:hypothetical protein
MLVIRQFDLASSFEIDIGEEHRFISYAQKAWMILIKYCIGSVLSPFI